MGVLITVVLSVVVVSTAVAILVVAVGTFWVLVVVVSTVVVVGGAAVVVVVNFGVVVSLHFDRVVRTVTVDVVLVAVVVVSMVVISTVVVVSDVVVVVGGAVVVVTTEPPSPQAESNIAIGNSNPKKTTFIFIRTTSFCLSHYCSLTYILRFRRRISHQFQKILLIFILSGGETPPLRTKKRITLLRVMRSSTAISDVKLRITRSLYFDYSRKKTYCQYFP